MTMPPARTTDGNSPIVLSIPHGGTGIAPDIWRRLNEEGRKLRDTDWHVARLYEGILPKATVVEATFHRYCIDANRDPTGESLYPGQFTTGLIPATDFDGNPIWRAGEEPGAADVDLLLRELHAVYHRRLAERVARTRKKFGVAVLIDCHSIRSVCPRLFEGVLPDFNIGTDDGRTCAPEIQDAVANVCANAEGYTSVLNGRFRGGWTTRHYGRPEEGIHAIQIELAQSTYLKAEEPPFEFDYDKARRLRAVLADILQSVEAIAKTLRIPKGNKQ